ncbi:hypothetical protein [Streptomyces sp. NPDC051909]|uniref:hypothetical protein n=1 Tax=Streptomyces sp. NPDC051909 TaxID=3154944 RepID=UPI0034393F81
MTVRRTLGPGPQASAPIRAAQADLNALPSVHLPDLDELRGRGVLGPRRPLAPSSRRALGAGATADEV